MSGSGGVEGESVDSEERERMVAEKITNKCTYIHGYAPFSLPIPSNFQFQNWCNSISHFIAIFYKFPQGFSCLCKTALTGEVS